VSESQGFPWNSYKVRYSNSKDPEKKLSYLSGSQKGGKRKRVFEEKEAKPGNPKGLAEKPTKVIVERRRRSKEEA